MASFCENPTEAIALQLVENPGVTPHIHLSAELVYIERGEVTLSMGSLEFSLHPGDYAFIMPNTLHSYNCGDYAATILVINCQSDVVGPLLKRQNGFRPVSPVLRGGEVPLQLDKIVMSLSKERDVFIAAAWANLAFEVAASRLKFIPIQESITTNLSSRILSYLAENFRKDVTLDNLSESMGVSKYHISHMFASKLGVGFKEYLNNLRIENAKNLLSGSDLSISDICYAAGFDNQRTFNRVFREITGMTPRNYRISLGTNVEEEESTDLSLPSLTTSSISDLVAEQPAEPVVETAAIQPAAPVEVPPAPAKKAPSKASTRSAVKPIVKKPTAPVENAESADDSEDKPKKKMPSWML